MTKRSQLEDLPPSPYHSGMDPTIAGALIGGGFAVIGFAASAWQNSPTLRATQRAAREQRLWEKRTTLYEELLAIATEKRTTVEAMRRDFAKLQEHYVQLLAYGSAEVMYYYEWAERTCSKLPAEGEKPNVAIEYFGWAMRDLRYTMRDELLLGRVRIKRLFVPPPAISQEERKFLHD